MIWIVVVAAVAIVVLFTAARLLRADRRDEVDSFARARQMTTGWANGEPPPEPVGRSAEGVLGEHAGSDGAGGADAPGLTIVSPAAEGKSAQ